MSTQLIQVQTPRALAALESNLDLINEAISANISGGGISDFDLPRVKISGGSSPRWIVPTLEGEESIARIEGVIVFARDTRVYYKTAFGKGPGKLPPDCSSPDGVVGKGSPGGDCSRCPLAEYGSADEGAGQACKQVKQLFVLRGDLLLPEVLSLPPTSLKGARQFFLKLTTQGIPYYQAVISIELEKAHNAAGIEYGKAQMKFVRRLSPEEAARAQQYHELCRSLAVRVPMGLDPETREQPGDQGPF
ncbi:MAG: hypothetical protein KJZ70_10405 [Bryobacterales bacterium]|nr:hypothetical protein [Bryobacterales bacterium]